MARKNNRGVSDCRAVNRAIVDAARTAAATWPADAHKCREAEKASFVEIIEVDFRAAFMFSAEKMREGRDKDPDNGLLWAVYVAAIEDELKEAAARAVDLVYLYPPELVEDFLESRMKQSEEPNVRRLKAAKRKRRKQPGP